MTKDRLPDLHKFLGRSHVDVVDEVDGETVALQAADKQPLFMEDFHKEIDEIYQGLNEIGSKVEQMKLLHNEIISAPSADDRKKAQLDDLMADVKKRSSEVSERLKDMQRKNAELETISSDNAETRIRHFQHLAVLTKFMDSMNDYNAQQVHYRDQCRERIRRQLVITGQHVSDEELEDLLEKGDFAVFTQGIIIEKQKAQQMLKDIEARHNDIVQLEKSLKELCDLFNDLALLILNQAAIVDQIEYNVQKAKDFVDSGKSNLGEAQQKQSAARKKKICLIICVLVAVIILIIVIALGVALR